MSHVIVFSLCLFVPKPNFRLDESRYTYGTFNVNLEKNEATAVVTKDGPFRPP